MPWCLTGQKLWGIRGNFSFPRPARRRYIPTANQQVVLLARYQSVSEKLAVRVKILLFYPRPRLVYIDPLCLWCHTIAHKATVESKILFYRGCCSTNWPVSLHYAWYTWVVGSRGQSYPRNQVLWILTLDQANEHGQDSTCHARVSTQPFLSCERCRRNVFIPDWGPRRRISLILLLSLQHQGWWLARGEEYELRPILS